MKLLFVLALAPFFASNTFAQTVAFETTSGNFEVELNPTAAPITVANFLKYLDAGYFNQTLFHRVIKNFVVQGGILDASFKEIFQFDAIKNEAKNGLSNLKGTIAMARTSEVDSATSSFFINTVDNTRLDYQSDEKYGYAVFGKVTSGYDVIEAIENAPTHSITLPDEGDMGDVPVQNIIVKNIHRK